MAALGEDSILGTTAADRCNVCGSEMAPDQAYCVECGTRRGRPRFTLDGARRAAAAGAAVGSPAPVGRGSAAPTSPHRGWWASSASATLLTGVAVLLLAMGVGFEIGHSGRTSSASGGTHITVNGGGSGGSSSTTGSTASGGSHHHHHATAAAATPKKPATTKKALAQDLAKASKSTPQSGQAANKVLHTKTGVKIAPPSTTVGGKCAKGTVGCQNGKFTGNVFGST